MKKFDKWWLPEGETHLPQWMKTVNKVVDGRLTYQYGKYEEAMKYVKNKALAIDIGSHVGLWAYFMARDFNHLVAFEPMQEHIDCWKLNMAEKNNVELHNCALGADHGKVYIGTRTQGSSGDTGIVQLGLAENLVEIMPLDALNLQNVGFIKIDCEGYEANVLKGAEETIERCKPVIVVEQKGNMSEQYGIEPLEAVRWLMAMGYECKADISGDYIMVY